MKPAYAFKTLLAMISVSLTVSAAAQTWATETMPPASISATAIAIAAQVMADYTSSPVNVGIIPGLPVWEWWLSGAWWSALLDYTTYVKDTKYLDTIIHALTSQEGLLKDFESSPYLNGQIETMGTDDVFWWANSALAASEADTLLDDPSVWTAAATNAYQYVLSYWQPSAKTPVIPSSPDGICANGPGGLFWKIDPVGSFYISSISNGGLFQLAARLYHLTGNETYSKNATNIWEWSKSSGLVNISSSPWQVYDGLYQNENCYADTEVNWGYTTAVYMYGAAVMWDKTKKDEWHEITLSLLEAAIGPKGVFISVTQELRNIKLEYDELIYYDFKPQSGLILMVVCEPFNTCDDDQLAFKGIMARWLAKTYALLDPVQDNQWRAQIRAVLQASAIAAANLCINGVCGGPWYHIDPVNQPKTGKHLIDNTNPNAGPWQMNMAALETIQALLMLEDPTEFPMRENAVLAKPAGPSKQSSPATKSPTKSPVKTAAATSPKTTKATTLKTTSHTTSHSVTKD